MAAAKRAGLHLCCFCSTGVTSGRAVPGSSVEQMLRFIFTEPLRLLGRNLELTNELPRHQGGLVQHQLLRHFIQLAALLKSWNGAAGEEHVPPSLPPSFPALQSEALQRGRDVMHLIRAARTSCFPEQTLASEIETKTCSLARACAL